MFLNLAYRTRPREGSGADDAVNHCSRGGTERSGGPLARPGPATAGSPSHESRPSTRAFGPSDVQIAQEQQQTEAGVPASDQALPATATATASASANTNTNTTPSDFSSSSGSSWPSLVPMSSPSPPLPSAHSALTSAAPLSCTPHLISKRKPSTPFRGRPRTKRSKFVKMDMSELAHFTAGGPPDLDARSDSMYDSDGGADSLAGSLGSTQEVTENIYMTNNIPEDIPEEESDFADEAAHFVVTARAKDNSSNRKSSSKSGPGHRTLFSRVRNQRGSVKGPIARGRGTPRSLPDHSGAGAGPFPLHAAHRSGRITRRRASATSNDSITQYRLTRARLGRAGSLSARSHKLATAEILSLTTEEAFPAIKKGDMSDDDDDDVPDAPETETETIDREAIWAALARIPGFAFPSLDVFLTEHHPWTVAWPALDVVDDADDADDVEHAEARIQSINGVLPLGRRAAALDRLGLVLASHKIKQICGRSLPRTRVPSFLTYSLDEQSRVWAAEAAAAGRQSFLAKQGPGSTGSTGSIVSPRPLDKIDDALASRFKLGYLANFVSASIDMDIDTSTLTGAAPTHVDGRLAALVVQDMLSLLASARDAFNKQEVIDRAKGKGKDKDRGKNKGQAVATGGTTSKHQRQVLLAFNNAVQARQTLQQFRSDVQQREAAAKGIAPMEVDLFEKMKL